MATNHEGPDHHEGGSHGHRGDGSWTVTAAMGGSNLFQESYRDLDDKRVGKWISKEEDGRPHLNPLRNSYEVWCKMCKMALMCQADHGPICETQEEPSCTSGNVERNRGAWQGMAAAAAAAKRTSETRPMEDPGPSSDRPVQGSSEGAAAGAPHDRRRIGGPVHQASGGCCP